MWTVEFVSDVPGRLAMARELLQEYVLLPDAWTRRGGVPEQLPDFFAREFAALPSPAVRPDGDIAVCVDEGGDAIGVALLVPFEAGLAELKRLYVRPAVWRSGAGTALVTHQIDLARALGYSSVVIDVMAERAAALGLYEKLGFAPTPAFRTYDEHDMLFFRLDL